MTRRSEPDATSFDLFLDTICNTFGGVVFLAILLALMIQTRAVVKSDDTTADKLPTPDEIRDSIHQLDLLASQHATLAAAMASTPLQARSSDDSRLIELSEQASKAEAELSQLTQANAASTKTLGEMTTSNADLDAENKQLPVAVATAQEQIKVGENRYVAAAQAKQESLRLPKTRESNAASYLVLFKSDRIYLARRPAFVGESFNVDHVRTNKLASGGTEVIPVPSAGWDFGSSSGNSEIMSLISDVARGRNIMTIAIWPDCFDKFDSLRESLINQNVPYQLWLQQDGEELVIFFGSGSSRIQ